MRRLTVAELEAVTARAKLARSGGFHENLGAQRLLVFQDVPALLAHLLIVEQELADARNAVIATAREIIRDLP